MLRVPDWMKKIDDVKVPFIQVAWRRKIIECENRFIDSVIISENMLNTHSRAERVVFSLTSFPERINSVQKTIKSLMLQTYKPDMIVLWLAKSQFENTVIPESLKELEQFGLTVRFCELDLKSHKKYYYAMKEFRNDIIITFDDDIIYGEKVVERLIKKHNRFPNCVVADSAKLIAIDKNDNIKAYDTWKNISSVGVHKPSMRLMAMTGSGCLYPPSCMPEQTFDIELMEKLSFSADDIWMKYNQILAGIKVIKSYRNHRTYIVTDDYQKESLSMINCLDGENDRIIKKIFQNDHHLIELMKK